MDIVIKTASILAGERSVNLSIKSILEKDDISEKRKVELIQRLEMKHQVELYKLLVKTTSIILEIIKFIGVFCVIIGTLVLSSESKSFVYNIVGGLLFFALTFFSYFMYYLVEEDLAQYKRDLRTARRKLKLLK